MRADFVVSLLFLFQFFFCSTFSFSSLIFQNSHEPPIVLFCPMIDIHIQRPEIKKTSSQQPLPESANVPEYSFSFSRKRKCISGQWYNREYVSVLCTNSKSRALSLHGAVVLFAGRDSERAAQDWLCVTCRAIARRQMSVQSDTSFVQNGVHLGQGYPRSCSAPQHLLPTAGTRPRRPRPDF